MLYQISLSPPPPLLRFNHLQCYLSSEALRWLLWCQSHSLSSLSASCDAQHSVHGRVSEKKLLKLLTFAYLLKFFALISLALYFPASVVTDVFASKSYSSPALCSPRFHSHSWLLLPVSKRWFPNLHLQLRLYTLFQIHVSDCFNERL